MTTLCMYVLVSMPSAAGGHIIVNVANDGVVKFSAWLGRRRVDYRRKRWLKVEV